MKKIMNHVVVMVIMLVTVVEMLLVLVQQGYATVTLTENQFAEKIQTLREEYPNESYWCEKNGNRVVNGYTVSKAGEKACGCTCNEVCICSIPNNHCGRVQGVGWRGFGFANLLCLQVFGSYAMKEDSAVCNTQAGWRLLTGSSITAIYAGDFVMLKDNRTVFIVKVTDNRIYYAECNHTAPCQISWDRYFSGFEGIKGKTEYVCRYGENRLTGTGKANGTLTVRYDINGGKLTQKNETLCTYKVLYYVDYIHLRSTPQIGDNIIGTIAQGKEFIAEKTSTVTANGYAWLRASYNGKTGYVAKTSSIQMLSELQREDYYVKDSLLYAYGSGEPVISTYYYAEQASEELFTDKDFNLERPGYVFKGWSLSKTSNQCISIKNKLPETVVPKNGKTDVTVTVYAVWEANKPYLTVSNAQTKAGRDADLTVGLMANPGLSSGVFQFSYNKSIIEIVDIQPAVSFIGIDETDTVRLVSQTNETAEGTVFTVTLRFADDAAIGDYPVTVSAVECKNTNGDSFEVKQATGTVSVIKPVCNHEWNAGVITKQPTQTEDGKITYTCLKCGTTKTQSIGIQDITEHKSGDADGDNTVTASDARLVLRASVGLEMLTEAQRKAADVDKDNAITASDARLILRAAVGLSDSE